MSVKTLMEWLGKPNLVEEVLDKQYENGDSGEDTIQKLANQVCEDADRDLDSMKDWVDLIEEGRKIAKQETNAKSEPWEGASNFKSPSILGAAIKFGDRATTELLRGKKILSAEVIGRDPDGQKMKSMERVTDYMNWQIDYEMEEWREIQEQLLYELPNTGCVFKKVYFDPIQKINRSELVRYPDFIVNQSMQSMKDRLPFTQPMDISYGEVLEKQAAGLWYDCDIYPKDAEQDDGSNAKADTVVTLDNEEAFYEQHCFYDLDDDGYAEPYTVTVHKESRKVVRIVARYRADGIYAKDSSGSTGKVEDFQSEDLTLVLVKPSVEFVKYSFIPCVDGTFLGWGYYHILTSLSKAENVTTNQLVDAGMLANLQGGFVARGFRKKMGQYKFKPGVWEATDIAASDLQSGILPHPFKEPSSTLFALNEKIGGALKELALDVDLKGVLSPNAPASTTLALIQEAAVPTSAIIQRVIWAESKEFRKLFELNAQYADPKTYQEVLDDPDANYRNDFDLRKLNMMPTASAEISTKMQRIQQAQTMISEAEKIGLMGGDIRPLYENWFNAIGADYMINQVWPDPAMMTEQQQQRAKEAEAEKQKQNMLLGIEIDHKERDLEIKESLAKSDIALKNAELYEKAANIRKTESEIILNLEKAETEANDNQINLYTAELAGVREIKETIKQAIEANNNVGRDDRKAGAVPESARNNQ
jgi:chaperonin GroES